MKKLVDTIGLALVASGTAYAGGIGKALSYGPRC
jgi:hypothetical protein